MHKMTLLAISLIFSSLSYAKNGNGAGNGGLGFVCKLDSYIKRNREIVFTLDVFENLRQHYQRFDLQKNYDIRDNRVPHLIENLEIKKETNSSFSITSGSKGFTEKLKEIFDKDIDLSLPFLQKIFNQNETMLIQKAKEKILNNTKFEYILKNQITKNQTMDSGIVSMPTEKTLQFFGLSNCKMTQLAQLIKTNNSNSSYQLKLYLGRLFFLDNLNLSALFWHEILFLALPDISSERIRILVSRILQEQ